MNMKEFDAIIGYSAVKKELEQIADVLKNDVPYKRLGVTPPHGLLIHGEPGVGKTLMATALVKASGRKVFIGRKDQPNGDFVKAIKNAFDQAASETPSIIFLDDMDKFSNGDERHPDAEEYVTVQSCVDEIRDKEVFVLATANNLRCLPRSLLRAGRFDRSIRIDAPHGADAERITAYYLSQKKFVSDVDVQTIARIMDGRSCAELETVINEAGLYAGFERSDSITMKHFMKACMRILFDMPESDLPTEDDCLPNLCDGDNILSQISYHEAGHAICGLFTEGADPIHKATIIPRGRALGMVQYLPEKDRYSFTRQQMLARLTVAMGGRAAEELKFGNEQVTSGAAGDISMATNLARSMVTEWGMSDSLGPVLYAENSGEVFLGKSVTQNKNMSEDKNAAPANSLGENMKKLMENGK